MALSNLRFLSFDGCMTSVLAFEAHVVRIAEVIRASHRDEDWDDDMRRKIGAAAKATFLVGCLCMPSDIDLQQIMQQVVQACPNVEELHGLTTA